MKRIIVTLALLLIPFAQVCPQPVSPLTSQGGWFWQELNFPNDGIIKFIETNSDGDIFIINQQGSYKSTDNGLSWDTLPIPGNAIDAIAINSMNDIYIGYDFSIYRSTDNGASWSYVGLQGLKITAIGFNSFNHIFVGTEIPDYSSIYRSTDNGATWTELGLTGSWSNISLICINSLNVIFAVRDQVPELGLFASFDNGENWSFQSIYVNFSVDFDTLNNILAGRYEGIFYSTDNGLTWIDRNYGISNSYAYSVKTNISNHFFISTASGIYRSIDEGESWEEINGGLGNSEINVLQINKDGYIFGGSSNGKVYRSINSTTGIIEDNLKNPQSFILTQNYPNPFNPGTKISWQSPAGSHQVLKVFDVLGREVATLVDEYKDAGYNEVEFNSAGLSSGVYFYRLQSGNFVETKKMVILR